MGIFENISKLAKKQGETPRTVALSLGFSENLFYRWKTTQPKAIDLAKVANYFAVPIEYLLDKEISGYTETDLSRLLWQSLDFDGNKITEEDKIFIDKFLRGYFLSKEI